MKAKKMTVLTSTPTLFTQSSITENKVSSSFFDLHHVDTDLYLYVSVQSLQVQP